MFFLNDRLAKLFYKYKTTQNERCGNKNTYLTGAETY